MQSTHGQIHTTKRTEDTAHGQGDKLHGHHIDTSGTGRLFILTYSADIDPSVKGRGEIRNAYKDVLTSSVSRESAAGVSLFGPHRDDVRILLGDKDTRLFASQGQQRSCVLALKLGEGEVIKEITGEYPVYLFDDVLSELDEKRRSYVLGDTGEKQIIITSCESEEYERYGANRIDVSGGEYVSSYRK
jgi:DNA replication and repair protein RecF